MYVDSVYKYFHNYRISVEGATLKLKWKAELSRVSDPVKIGADCNKAYQFTSMV